MHSYLKRFFILFVTGGFLGIFFSYILNMLTKTSSFENNRSIFILGFSVAVWLFVTFFNTILYNKNIDVDINIGFKVNPVFLGVIFGILFSYNFFKL